MRIKSFGVRSIGPVGHVQVDDLANVVVLAGPNGVGKTSVLNALLRLAQDPASKSGSSADTWMLVSATSSSEREQWKKDLLDTRLSGDAQLLQRTLQQNRKRNKFGSSFLNFDSDRSIRNVQPFNFSWDIGNPATEEIGWHLSFQRLSDRFNDVRHSLFRLVENQRREVADRAFQLRDAGAPAMPVDFPDVLRPYKEAFFSLLGPKRLVEVNVRDQTIYYEYNSEKLSIDSLSSGEREVVNIVFDFILRNPVDCVIMFDEPELHLHPELSYRMLQTLSGIGVNNQFIFSTHSPEIITASLENTVIFVRPRQQDDSNQAVVVHRDDATHHALQALGQSIGVISLGKKLVLIEGDESSLDKQTYGAILKNRFPELILVPVGGKDALRSFDDIKENIIDKTIWGVSFFMLCDRDAVSSLGPLALASAGSSQIRQIPRYHIENYFLDQAVMCRTFEAMEPHDSWLRDADQINLKLREIAKGVIPYAVALNVNATFREAIGNVSLVPRGVGAVLDVEDLVTKLRSRAVSERDRVIDRLNLAALETTARAEFQRLASAVDADDAVWRRDIPGRPILNKFAATAGIQVGRLKQMFLAAGDIDRQFKEIVEIFESFSAA